MFESHIGQDMWVTQVYKNCSSGFFLDFGAFDGVTISNTYFLEKKLGWEGICVEPNFHFFSELCRNRNSICLNGALWPVANIQLSFVDAHGLSGIQGLSTGPTSDLQLRHTKRIISVSTLNPTDILVNFNAPNKIHYMSLDTEGAELDIVSAIDFNTYEMGLITIEHNHDEVRKTGIREILVDMYNYEVLQVKNEDWFWKTSTISELTKIPVSQMISPGIVAQEVERLYGIRE